MQKHTGKISKIIVHITATPFNTTPEAIKRGHLAQGWSDYGYHWLIDQNGTVHKGRDEQYIGSHVQHHNDRSIGIAYIAPGSNHDSNAQPYDKYMKTPQRESLARKCAELLKKYNLPITALYGHNDFTSAKACPCFKVRSATDFLNKVKFFMGTAPSGQGEPKKKLTHTEAQVLINKDFQKRNGLDPDGKVGPATTKKVEETLL